MDTLILFILATFSKGSQDQDWSALRARLGLLTSADLEERVQARSAAKEWDSRVLLGGLNEKSTRGTAALALGVQPDRQDPHDRAGTGRRSGDRSGRFSDPGPAERDGTQGRRRGLACPGPARFSGSRVQRNGGGHGRRSPRHPKEE